MTCQPAGNPLDLLANIDFLIVLANLRQNDGLANRKKRPFLALAITKIQAILMVIIIDWLGISYFKMTGEDP